MEGSIGKHTSRNDFLDYLKGILIFLVILGHFIQYFGYHSNHAFFVNKLWKAIYIFHMPLFIIISGYFSYFSIQKHQPLTYIKGRLLYLFIPMCTWCFIESVLNIVISQKFNIGILLKSLINNIEYNYWFIWSIIFYSIFMCIMNKLKLVNIYILLAVGSLVMFFPYNHYIGGLIESFYPFFIGGYLYAQFKPEKHYKSIYKILPVLIIASAFLYSKWAKPDYVYITPSQWEYIDITLFRLIASTITSITFAICSFIIYKRTKEYHFTSFIIKAGKNSLAIYLIQTVFFDLIYEYTAFDLCENYTAFIFIIPSIFLLIFLQLLVKYTSKNKVIAFLFYGKKIR